MPNDPVERLRERVAPMLYSDRDGGAIYTAQDVLAAIVEELGVTEAHEDLMVSLCAKFAFSYNGAATFEVRDALSTLLRASRTEDETK